MANKSVIDIDVRDEKFRAFYELYKDFSDKLDDMPESWKTLNEGAAKAQEAMAAGFGDIAGHLSNVSGGLQDLNKHLRDAKALQKQFGELTGTSEGAMKKMAHASKELRENLFGIGNFIMKFGAAGLGIFTGGMFGLDKLAQSAIATQRTARGLGLTPGQIKAFDIDVAQRGYATEGTLAKITESKNDFKGRVMLSRALGLTPQQIDSTDNVTLALKMAMKEHELWNSTPENERAKLFMMPWWQQLGQGVEQFQLNGKASMGELVAAQMNYQRDSRKLNLNDKQLDGLYSFERQLRVAGQTLETELSKKLSDLAGPLGNLITVLGKDGKILIDQVLTPQNIDRVGVALDDLVKVLGGAASLIRKLYPSGDPLPGETDAKGNVKPGDASFLGRLGWELLGSDTAGKWAAEKAAAIHGGASPLDARQKGSTFDHLYGWYARLNGYDPDTGKPVVPFNKSDAATLFASLEKARGLPPGTLMAVAQKESSFNPLAISKKGNKGLFQFGDTTAKQYDVKDPYNWVDESIGAAAYLSDLYKKYGSWNKAFAAYNWGPGNLDADIKKWGDAWRDHVPGETADYVPALMKRQIQAAKAAYAPKPAQTATTDAAPPTPALSNAQAMLLRPRNPNVNIRIFNEAGANVAVSTNAASAVAS